MKINYIQPPILYDGLGVFQRETRAQFFRITKVDSTRFLLSRLFFFLILSHFLLKLLCVSGSSVPLFLSFSSSSLCHFCPPVFYLYFELSSILLFFLFILSYFPVVTGLEHFWSASHIRRSVSSFLLCLSIAPWTERTYEELQRSRSMSLWF